ncbi:ATP-binding cassette domain-containing protein, partial [Gordonia sp. (in: high G+C Gram-positive bacteria)]
MPDDSAYTGTAAIRATRRDLTALSATERAQLFAGVAAESGSPKPDPIIVVDNISRTFGGIKAVQVDHLEVQRGAITGLIGPNGAGKTTFFNLITGFDKPDSGTWSLNGDSLGRMVPHQVARRGMVRTFQLTKALAKLTVLDNVRLGATGQRGEHFLAALAPWVWR